MGTAKAVISIVVTVAMVGPPANARAAEPDPAALELRVVTHSALDPADLEIARQSAQAMLGSAGITTAWRECAGIVDHCADPGDRPFVLVHLFPTTKSSDPTRSGEATRAPSTAIPVIIVYVRRNEELAEMFRRPSGARSNPALTTLTTGHLVGFTIAHEVGHLLGLVHTSVGLMKPQLTPEDVVALRTSGRAFLPKERESMRLALNSDTAFHVAASITGAGQIVR